MLTKYSREKYGEILNSEPSTFGNIVVRYTFGKVSSEHRAKPGGNVGESLGARVVQKQVKETGEPKSSKRRESLALNKCGSVDTLDCTPPPALPPRRPPWPPNNLSPATLRNLGKVAGSSSSFTNASSSSSSSSSSSTSSLSPSPSVTGTTASSSTRQQPISHKRPTTLNVQRTPPPPILAPPQYPAPPRPPSRNGGDEARVARAGSGRGESSFANGTPSSRALPPRAGWAVRQNNATVSSSPLLPEQAAFGTSTGIKNHNARTNSSAGQSSSCLGQWTSDNKSRTQQRSPLSHRVGTTTTAGLSSSQKSFLEQSSNHNQQNTSLSTVEFSPIAAGGATSALTASGLLLQQQQQRDTNVLGSRQNQSNNHFHVDKIATNRGGGGGSHWHERLELRGDALSMSQNALSPPSRPPSSASSASNTSTTNNLPRVHTSALSYGGHDHTRPLPPPRLPEAISTTGITTISSSSISSLTIAPLTAPLTPLATSASFRSNNSRTSASAGVAVGSTSTTTTSNNNINNNNNNNINNSTTTTTHHVQPNIADSSAIGLVVGTANSSSLNNSTNSTSQSRSTSTTNTSGGGGGDTGSRSGAPLGEVTLTVPRPDGERAVNEYVETPFRQTNSTATNLVCNLVASNQKCLKNERRLHHHHHHHHHNHHNNHNHQHHQQLQQNQQQQQHHQQQHLQSTAQSKNASTAALVTAHARNQENSGSIRRHQSHLLQSSLSVTSPSAAVTKQPVSFTKEPANALGSGSLVGTGGRLNDPSLSIMCDFCGRCRCESCREPPPLPSRWLCDNACFCSAETALDYASCLCCVKGLFYHCADSGSGTDSEAGGNCADEPCSCTGPRRTARWACLGALTFVLPCLLCYWPLKGCVAMCEACYARHAAQGCRCDPNAHGRHHAGGGATSVVSRDSRDPEKRLLDPVTPEL